MHSKEDGGAPRVWFESWNSTIQPKLDRLLEVSSEREPKSGHPDGLLVLMSGDSTMIQQFQVLSEFIFLRHDFYPVVGKDAERLQVLYVLCRRCSVCTFFTWKINAIFFSVVLVVFYCALDSLLVWLEKDRGQRWFAHLYIIYWDKCRCRLGCLWVYAYMANERRITYFTGWNGKPRKGDSTSSAVTRHSKL